MLSCFGCRRMVKASCCCWGGSADRGGQGRNGRRERRAYEQVGREGTGSSDEEGGALTAMGGPR